MPVSVWVTRSYLLSICGEGELVSRVQTLVVGRSAHVVYELQVQEEREGVRQEVQEMERESQGGGETLR